MGDNTQPNAEMLANMMRIFQMMGAGPGGMPLYASPTTLGPIIYALVLFVYLFTSFSGKYNNSPRTDKPPASQLAISELEDVEIDQRLLDKGVTQCAICTGTSSPASSSERLSIAVCSLESSLTTSTQRNTSQRYRGLQAEAGREEDALQAHLPRHVPLALAEQGTNIARAFIVPTCLTRACVVCVSRRTARARCVVSSCPRWTPTTRTTSEAGVRSTRGTTRTVATTTAHRTQAAAPTTTCSSEALGPASHLYISPESLAS